MEKESPELTREEKFTRAKQKVKTWESEYVAVHGCRPNKEALSAAPSDIRVAYKIYCYYRKVLDCSQGGTEVSDVRNQSNDVQSSKALEVSVNTKYDKCEESPSFHNNENSVDTTSSVNVGLEKNDEHEESGSNCDSVSVTLPPSNEVTQANLSQGGKVKGNIWGKHLNKATLSDKVLSNKTKEVSLYSKMAEKLRASGTVKVRTSLKKLTPVNKFRKKDLKESDYGKESVLNDSSITSSVIQPDKENLDKSEDSKFESKEEFDSQNIGFDSLENSVSNDVFSSSCSVFDALNKNDTGIKTDSVFSDTSNALHSVDDNLPKLPFRVQRSQNIKKSLSQPVNVILASNANEPHAENNIKKKAALNRGWLARCVGPDLNVELDNDNDSWKMKLVDREWTEDMEEAEQCLEEEKDNVVTASDLKSTELCTPKRGRGRGRGKATVRGRGRGKKQLDSMKNNDQTSCVENEHEADKLYGEEENIDKASNWSPVKPKSTRGKRGRGTKNLQSTSRISGRRTRVNNDQNYEMEHSMYDNESPSANTKVTVECSNDIKDNLELQECLSGDLSNDPFEFIENCDEVQENNFNHNVPRRMRSTRSGLRNVSIVDKDEFSDDAEETCVKRKRGEDLEELEKSGKIQSSWPPPKKARKARKPASKTSKSRKKIQKIKDAEIPVVFPVLEETKTSRPLRRPRKRVQMASPTQETKIVRTRRKVNNRKILNNTECGGAVKVRETPAKRVDEVKMKETSAKCGDVVKMKETPAAQEKKQISDESEGMKEYDELDDIESNGKKSKSAKVYLSKEDYLKRKVTSGSANNNYVRINLKKKIFVRGKKTMTSGKYKRQEWKKKQMMKSAEGGNEVAIKALTCFKCGDFGHWAKYCPGKKGDGLMPLEQYDEKESTFLSLEDAASLARGIKPSDAVPVSRVYSTTEGLSQMESQHSIIDSACSEEAIETPAIVSHPPKDRDEKSSIEDSSEPALIENREESGPCQSENSDTHQAFELDDELFTNLDMDSLEMEEAPPNLTSSQLNSPAMFSSISVCNRPTVDPLYALENGKVGPTTDEVRETLRLFGYTSFRTGQENAIMRILSGQSTLLVLSTGSGKSLCYQLPAYLYAKRSSCITLCISPLVSLMEDQVSGLPNFLHAVCLHTHQNHTQRANAVSAIQSGNAHILLVSPEAIVGCQTGGMLGSLLKDLPPVAFACLDEAHCVSEWSHNFRPSYLRVCQVLRERLGVKTILGLTATARHATALSIAEHLEIDNFETGIIRGTSVPGNLMLSASRDGNREHALIALLQGDRFANCSSIIIYCTRRDECERVATLIRSQLLEPSKVNVKSNLKRARGISYDAEAYHAGLSSYRRQQVQKQFMSGKVRIVVATVAFGMGIDKSDVQGIIHFNMPRNIESYVQEIGRAGRDGEEAHCHLFLDSNDGKDIQELKRHIYANSLDRHTVRKLLNLVFKPCTCLKVKNLTNESEELNSDKDGSCDEPKSPGPSGTTSSSVTSQSSPTANGNSAEDFFPVFPSSSCPKHEVAIPITDLVEKLDLPEENLETLLCYLELHWGNLVKLSSHVYGSCSVACYGGPRQLVAVSRRCPPLGVAIALERQRGVIFDKSNKVSFPVVEIASRMGWNSKIVKRELKALEWNTLGLPNGGQVKKSGVAVEFSDLSFHMEARGDLTDDERDQLLDALFRRIQMREREQLRQLHYTYQLLHSVSHKSILMCCDDVDLDRCSRLREGLSGYFAKEGKILSDVRIEEQVYVRPDIEGHIRSSVRGVLSTHTDHQWTGRAMARVFHGIGSPNFPASVWGRVRRIWRQHLNTDFNILVTIATQEILRCK